MVGKDICCSSYGTSLSLVLVLNRYINTASKNEHKRPWKYMPIQRLQMAQAENNCIIHWRELSPQHQPPKTLRRQRRRVGQVKNGWGICFSDGTAGHEPNEKRKKTSRWQEVGPIPAAPGLLPPLGHNIGSALSGNIPSTGKRGTSIEHKFTCTLQPCLMDSLLTSPAPHTANCRGC